MIKLITALKIATKPRGSGWADIDAWWNQLSAREMREAWHDFRAPFNR